MVHDLGLEKKEQKKERKHPMYPVQYLCNKTTTKVLDLGPTTKLVGIMAQDSVQKKKKKKKENRSKSNLKKNTDLCHKKWGEES